MTYNPHRAVTYGRQSKARDDDSAGSPRAQQDSTEAYVASRGWQHVGHFEDIGASGYDPKADRPGLDAVLGVVVRGGADLLVVYRLDRLTRRGVVEAVRLVGYLADHGAALVSVQEAFLDTSTPMGRGIFGIFAAMAEQESANISQRTKATKAVLAQAGSFAGGPRPYGFRAERETRDGLAVTVLRREPHEAAVVAQVAGAVLGGASIAGEARRLNREGTRTSTGAEWSTATLSRLLRSPIVAGYQSSNRGGIVRGDDGAPVAVWTPLVEPADWHRLQTVIAERSGGRGPRPTPTLLGGSDLLRCASCGGRMAGDRRTNGRGTYRCARHRRGSAECAGAAVAMAQTDDYIVRAVWNRLRDLDLSNPDDLSLLEAVAARHAEVHLDSGAEATRSAAQAALADAEAALLALDDDRAAGVFEGASGTDRYRRQVSALGVRADAARATLAAVPTGAVSGVDGLLDVLGDLRYDGMDPLEDADSPWRQWNVPERRAFLGLFLDEVTVAKGAGRAGGDHVAWRGHERLHFVWARRRPGVPPWLI